MTHESKGDNTLHLPFVFSFFVRAYRKTGSSNSPRLAFKILCRQVSQFLLYVKCYFIHGAFRIPLNLTRILLRLSTFPIDSGWEIGGPSSNSSCYLHSLASIYPWQIYISISPTPVTGSVLNIMTGWQSVYHRKKRQAATGKSSTESVMSRKRHYHPNVYYEWYLTNWLTDMEFKDMSGV